MYIQIYYGSDNVYYEAYYDWYFRGHESDAINVWLIFPRLKRSNPYYTMQAWVGWICNPWIHVFCYIALVWSGDCTSEKTDRACSTKATFWTVSEQDRRAFKPAVQLEYKKHQGKMEHKLLKTPIAIQPLIMPDISIQWAKWNTAQVTSRAGDQYKYINCTHESQVEPLPT